MGLREALGRFGRLRPRELLGALKRHKWTLAFLVACLITFLGPTYIIFALYEVGLSWPVPDITGYVLFSIGLISTAYLLAARGS